MSYKNYFPVFLFVLFTALTACEHEPITTANNIAPGAPGVEPTWAFAGKTGVGTSYEAYNNKHYSDEAITGEVSKVWFSIAKGVITETMFGLIHEAQIKDLQLVIVGEDFIDLEMEDTSATVDYLSKDSNGNPNSLAYKVVTRDKENKYEIEKHIFTHPDQQALYVRIFFRPFAENITPYFMLNPHMANTGIDDYAEVTGYGFHAWETGAEKAVHLSVVASDLLATKTVGFAGVSDGLRDLRQDNSLDEIYSSTGTTGGNVILFAALPVEPNGMDLVLGFGATEKQSLNAAKTTLEEGYQTVLAKYNGEGNHIGWHDYLASLEHLDAMKANTGDGGALLNVSAMVLKTLEDKTYSGALIASLSNPWGDSVPAITSHTGYKAVWPRDFYQCAMALLALGDKQTPQVAFEYLKKVQVTENTPGNNGATGWFLQKTHVDGELEWMAVQLDQTAMPVMLGWKLWQQGVLSNDEMTYWYNTMLKPAADFLVRGGKIDLGWNNELVTPPRTQQERWEEQTGYSPSTTAAVIAGLVTAADMAKASGDNESAARYLKTADSYSATIEKTLFTTRGRFDHASGEGGEHANGKYFLRITPNSNPNDNEKLFDRNGRGELNEYEILDGGFLELVRYGVRAPDDKYILDSLPEYDDTTLPHEFRVKYEFEFDGVIFPGWRRYGDDGYGEDANTGENYGAGGMMSSGQRGRVWPFFTGERGHYELALALIGNETNKRTEEIKKVYVRALEHFANEGLMLPEQVWDGVGADTKHGYEAGQGTNAATPLAWTHAEYVKLVRSLSDKKVWDGYPIVAKRYGDSGIND